MFADMKKLLAIPDAQCDGEHQLSSNVLLISDRWCWPAVRQAFFNGFSFRNTLIQICCSSQTAELKLRTRVRMTLEDSKLVSLFLIFPFPIIGLLFSRRMPLCVFVCMCNWFCTSQTMDTTGQQSGWNTLLSPCCFDQIEFVFFLIGSHSVGQLLSLSLCLFSFLLLLL